MFGRNWHVRITTDNPTNTPFRRGDTVVVDRQPGRDSGHYVVRLPDPLTPEYEHRPIDVENIRRGGGAGPGHWYVRPEYLEPLEREPQPTQDEQLPGVSDDLTSKADLAVAIANLEAEVERRQQAERDRLGRLWIEATRGIARSAKEHGFSASLHEVYAKVNDDLPSWMHVWLPTKKARRYTGRVMVGFEATYVIDEPFPFDEADVGYVNRRTGTDDEPSEAEYLARVRRYLQYGHRDDSDLVGSPYVEINRLVPDSTLTAVDEPLWLD